MAAPRKPSPFNTWDTVRCELLNTRVCDLGLAIEGSPVEPFVRRLHRELAAKGTAFRPSFYLTDTWGCPDRVPVIGVPFYLADRRLARIEEEQTGELEDDRMAMMLVRHEAGHAVNYAYRLWGEAGWAEAFGRFSQPYRETFQPEPFSRQFVRHIFSMPHGRTYAQKHPDEDFAETFAVWLAPRSAWRRRYRAWPALAKLKYVDKLMGQLRKQEPVRKGGKLYHPVEAMDMLLAEHYGQRAEQFRAAAQGYVDDRLRAVFPPLRGNSALPAGQILRKHHDGLRERMVRWSALDAEEAGRILHKLEDRADALHLCLRARHMSRKLMDVAAMAVAVAMEFAYTGRLTC